MRAFSLLVVVLAVLPVRATSRSQTAAITDAQLIVLNDALSPVQLEGVTVARKSNGTPSAVRVGFRAVVPEPLRRVTVDALLFDSKNGIRLQSFGHASPSALSVGSGLVTIAVNQLNATPDWKIVVGVTEVSFGSQRWAATDLRVKADAALRPSTPTEAASQDAVSDPVPAPAARSVWDGVYTTVQSVRGEHLYAAHCSSCHGNDLLAQGPDQLARDDLRIAGGAPQRTPALRGPAFVDDWNGLTIGDLFQRIRVSMPQQAPGSLSGQQVADIVAFLLQQNGFSSGDSELPKDRDVLQQIQIVTAR